MRGSLLPQLQLLPRTLQSKRVELERAAATEHSSCSNLQEALLSVQALYDQLETISQHVVTRSSSLQSGADAPETRAMSPPSAALPLSPKIAQQSPPIPSGSIEVTVSSQSIPPQGRNLAPGRHSNSNRDSKISSDAARLLRDCVDELARAGSGRGASKSVAAPIAGAEAEASIQLQLETIMAEAEAATQTIQAALAQGPLELVDETHSTTDVAASAAEAELHPTAVEVAAASHLSAAWRSMSTRKVDALATTFLHLATHNVQHTAHSPQPTEHRTHKQA